jgi:ATP-dependent DNA helicase RecG
LAASPFHSAIQAVLRPLEFAARAGAAQAERVLDLEDTVAKAARSAAMLAIPKEAREVLGVVAERFAAPLEGEARTDAVSRSLEEMRPLSDPAWAATMLERGPEALPGFGPRRARTLAKRGLHTIADLLFHLPARYDDRRRTTKVVDLEVGRRATFVARVLVCEFVARRGRFARTFEAMVGDETGTIHLKWFRGGDAIVRQVQKDAWLRITGDVRRYRFSKEVIHPELEPIDEAGGDLLHPVVPHYASAEGVHPRGVRRAIEAAVTGYTDLVSGWLPETVVRKRGLPTPAEALRAIHLPGADAEVEALDQRRSPAHQRLILEELYLLELGLALRRERQRREPGVPVEDPAGRARDAEARLPFELTTAQQRAWSEIRADLARPHPMNRLLEGDVGSGKTVVALLAAEAAAGSGIQTALMAPTELLAEQHFRTLTRLVELSSTGDSLQIALLTASVPRPQADAVRSALAAGEADLVVGTHALVQEGVTFRRLGLVVIDEQHRFGVLQRAALAAKGADGHPPHTLVMTATPIPRTLALTAYGDLDLSVIDELPPGRTPVETVLMRSGEGRRVMSLLRDTVERGEQVYVVYPLVEESEHSDLRAVSESGERLAAAFPGVRVDLVHGRLDASARAEAMARFERGESQVLVATTVIEVGVDVANATLMVIEHAERFGLAQLHQLRGRVGRGERPGTCVLVARGASEGSEARIGALLATRDGFDIAEADLRIRGPGEFLGTRQHGRLPDLRVADLIRDAGWIVVAREAARATVDRDPELARDRELLRGVRARWGEKLALVDVG